MRIDPRFRNIQNFRDLGGLETDDGFRVRKGLFYRGAGLGYFSEEELEEFSKLGIRTIMDLRSSMEMKELPDPEIAGARFIAHDGLSVKGSEDIDWSPEGMRKIGGEADEQLAKIRDYYQRIAFGNRTYQIMMKQIVDGELPIYFHCATGKDRTGVAAMIILLALGVREDQIRNDYLLSNVFRKKILEDSLAKVADIAKDHPEINELITIQDGVLEKTYETVRSSILERYGTFGEYLKAEFSLDEDTIKALKDRCLERIM